MPQYIFILGLIALLFQCPVTAAQDINTDSILALIKKEKSDLRKAELISVCPFSLNKINFSHKQY